MDLHVAADEEFQEFAGNIQGTSDFSYKRFRGLIDASGLPGSALAAGAPVSTPKKARSEPGASDLATSPSASGSGGPSPPPAPARGAALATQRLPERAEQKSIFGTAT